MSSLLGLNDGADSGYYIRYMPSANAWKTGDEEVDVKHLLLDPASIKTGWGKIQLGLSPDWHWDQQLGVRSSRPGNTEEEKMEYKRGFSVDLFGKEIGLRTWSATGTGATMGFEKLYAAIHSQLADNKGKVAVVEYTGSEAIKVGKGNTRVPQFSLLKWVESDEFSIEPTPPYEEPETAQPELATGSDLDFDDDIPF
jgi:hypothetical protein